MANSEKFCPVCKNKNFPGAIFCRYCGALLNNHPPDAATTGQTGVQPDVPTAAGDSFIDDVLIPVDGIAIYIAGTSKPIGIRSDSEFVIGRNTEDTSESLLDLSGTDSFNMGLSRRHAMIRRTKNGYEVIDLSSTNGTWLDDKRLVPNKPYPLASGTQLRLGRMRFLVFYHSGLDNK